MKRQVVLRDGRHLVGVMRSYDQFSNIVLEDTHERHFVGGELPSTLNWNRLGVKNACGMHARIR